MLSQELELYLGFTNQVHGKTLRLGVLNVLARGLCLWLRKEVLSLC